MTLHEHPEELLQRLLRFDTSNPPGNERPCISYIERLLARAGLETRILGRSPDRLNLVARLSGAGTAPPLLLHGHVDVVPAVNQQWRHPPFAGEIVDGYVWGRGALDMKGGVAMFLAALLRARFEKITPPGDVILALVTDEEAESWFGARYLVEQHPELFADVRYAISEFGGFSLDFVGRPFYPIQVAEKQRCWVRATVRRNSDTMASSRDPRLRLNACLEALRRRRLKVHVTPVVIEMIGEVAGSLPFPTRQMVRLLLNPGFTDWLIDLLGQRGARLDPLFRDAVDDRETTIHCGQDTAVADLMGRVLPGSSPARFVSELRRLCADDVELELAREDVPGPAAPDLGLYPLLASILRESDPSRTPVPFLLARGHTDARFFSRLGIQTYGWTPMPLPSNLNFLQLIHSADERVPVDAVAFGTRAVFQAICRFGEAG